MFYVTGGEYKDTSFSELVTTVARGPFDTYEEALDTWKALSWANVDDCHYKLWIKEK